MYVCIYLSICLSIHLSIHLPIYLSINLSIYLSIYLPIHLSIYTYTERERATEAAARAGSEGEPRHLVPAIASERLLLRNTVLNIRRKTYKCELLRVNVKRFRGSLVSKAH